MNYSLFLGSKLLFTLEVLKVLPDQDYVTSLFNPPHLYNCHIDSEVWFKGDGNWLW